jgi:hypothetical protein
MDDARRRFKNAYNYDFFPPILFFASSSPRHHFFFPSSITLLPLPLSLFLLPSPNERTNERTITYPSSQHLANLLAYHGQHFLFDFYIG